MASWKDTIKDDTEQTPTSSWKDTIQDDQDSSFMDKEIPLTPFFDPTVGDVVETAKASAPLLETAQDFSTGVAQGSTFGAADEIGGGIAAVAEKAASFIPGTGAYETRRVNEELGIPEESIGDAYRGYQQASEDEFKAAAERSPIANMAGQIGGSAVTGIAVGGALGAGNAANKTKSIYDVYKDSGKMKAGLELLKRGGTTYAKALPAIAAESALNSEGNLDNAESRQKLVEDTVGGMAFGLPAVLGVTAATDLAVPAAKAGLNKVTQNFDELAEKNPFLRKYKVGMEYGEQGIKPTSEAGLANLESQQIDRTTGMMDQIYAADKSLGKAVGKSIDDATAAGQRLDIAKPVTKALKALNFSYDTFQDMADNARGRKIFEKIQSNMGGDVTPREAKDLLDDVDAFIGKFNAARNRTTAEEATLSTLQKVRKELSDQMKKDIQEYGAAAERFTEFRKFVPETILSKDRPVDVTGVFMGNLRNSDKALYDSLNDLQMNATSQGSGSSNARKAYQNLLKGMDQFNANEAARGKINPLNTDAFKGDLRRFSDEAGFLKDVQTVKSPFVTGQNIVSTVGQFGHAGALSTSVLAGKAKKSIADISRKAYNLPPETLDGLANKLSSTPGLGVLGKALKDGLANGDQAKKNAAIFSILQNPEARLFIEQDEE